MLLPKCSFFLHRVRGQIKCGAFRVFDFKARNLIFFDHGRDVEQGEGGDLQAVRGGAAESHQGH